MRWLGKMVGERISCGSKQTTLFIPVGLDGFVAHDDGSVSLKTILVPIAKKPDATSGTEFAKRLIDCLNSTTGSVTLLHIGTPETEPIVE